MSRIINDDSEKLIASEPRVLKNPKRNYSQIEKEGLSVTFGVKQSHQYVSGQSFKNITDRKSYLRFFNKRKGIPSVGASHIQRWVIILSS